MEKSEESVGSHLVPAFEPFSVEWRQWIVSKHLRAANLAQEAADKFRQPGGDALAADVFDNIVDILDEEPPKKKKEDKK